MGTSMVDFSTRHRVLDVDDLLSLVHATHALYLAASAHFHDVIGRANAGGWRPDEDGSQALYAAGIAERDALRQYAEALEAFTAAVLHHGSPYADSLAPSIVVNGTPAADGNAGGP